MRRWTPKRKAELLEELDEHPERRAALMAEHGISEDELSYWRSGAIQGDLRVTTIQQRRRPQIGSRTIG